MGCQIIDSHFRASARALARKDWNVERTKKCFSNTTIIFYNSMWFKKIY